MTFIKIKHTDKNSSFKIFYQEYAPVYIYSWLATKPRNVGIPVK
jgi:hypothetical protein